MRACLCSAATHAVTSRGVDVSSHLTEKTHQHPHLPVLSVRRFICQCQQNDNDESVSQLRMTGELRSFGLIFTTDPTAPRHTPLTVSSTACRTLCLSASLSLSVRANVSSSCVVCAVLTDRYLLPLLAAAARRQRRLRRRTTGQPAGSVAAVQPDTEPCFVSFRRHALARLREVARPVR